MGVMVTNKPAGGKSREMSQHKRGGNTTIKNSCLENENENVLYCAPHR
jgi:hypothetical protein